MMLPFKGADICLILGNLLENAVEAAQKVDGKKYIEIKMKYDKNNILLSVTNSYSGKLLKTKDHRLNQQKLMLKIMALDWHLFIGQSQNIVGPL